MKKCTGCKIEKSESEFGALGPKRPGLKWKCKECEKAYQKAHYQKNREVLVVKKRATSAAWKKANPERAAADNKAYRIKHAVRLADRKKEQRNPGGKSRESYIEYGKKHHADNRERKLEYGRKWHAENKDKVAIRRKKWVEENRHACNERVRRRDAQKLNATPAWADKEKMLEFYEEAQRLNKETGIKWEVDHIVPLKNKIVCGLHCEFNLQVITKLENGKKNNKWQP